MLILSFQVVKVIRGDINPGAESAVGKRKRQRNASGHFDAGYDSEASPVSHKRHPSGQSTSSEDGLLIEDLSEAELQRLLTEFEALEATLFANL